MIDSSPAFFFTSLRRRNPHAPLIGQLELTSRCDFDCIHCYCLRPVDTECELPTDEWKRIIKELYLEGCFFLCLTGGNPLVREDFLEIYANAKEQGFIVAIFSNGRGFSKEIAAFLKKSPPYRIEITLNGITEETFGAVTQRPQEFNTVLNAITMLRRAGLPLLVKTNCMRENKDEIGEIKRWVETNIGRPSPKTHFFEYDAMVFPRLDGGKGPCASRLTFNELHRVRRQDPELWREYQKGLHLKIPALPRDARYLYQCSAWKTHFFINPQGRLKFCQFSEKFSVDLKKNTFHYGFYKVFPRLLKCTFKTESPCKLCRLRPWCYHCPARAYLENGNEEGPVSSYCSWAKEFERYVSAKK